MNSTTSFAFTMPSILDRASVTGLLRIRHCGFQLQCVKFAPDTSPERRIDRLVLFDAAHELTIVMHGLSQSTLPNSRDRHYHRGFPGRAGFDKGHAMSHAQGGREGGPNYFLQAPRVNRRLSPLGALWRDIESYLAANPGLFCFVRLAYPPETSTDVPAEVEYGLMAEGQFLTVIFPNS